MSELISQKVKQALEILKREQVDLWLIFVRESEVNHDPALDLVVDKEVTWESAFILSRNGDKQAIVGRGDVAKIKSLGIYEVFGYDQSIKPHLLRVLNQINPQKIAINFSGDNVMADGLSHGMYLLLTELLAGTPFVNRLVSAEKIISKLRGKKSNLEVRQIKKVIKVTEKIFSKLDRILKPGLSEQKIWEFFHAEKEKLKAETAWSEDQCPIVNAGPSSPFGHTLPSDKLKTKRGELLHVDFGLKLGGYCSDLQRMWYFLDRKERKIPDDIQKAWNTVRRAIEESAKILKLGVLGYQVDEIARKIVVQAGYPEYPHALGHQLGKFVHDGASLLGPRWERYGNTPYLPVEEGNVFTLELGVSVPNRGYLGLEEDVLITKTGCKFLSQEQKKLFCI
ncbi:MAG: peptidase M24 [candidate division Zixibacteria bacterium RBG-1]|nr:MAG: peptidase M24 [candidate division Zixibacteria bacterium RBG-1]OGC84105.1 MAG: hypothetical protein A2V73_00605 [candidate division Zixibacteria bacterium RBG_19FT_COMBO_42_43]